jgi:outer membrane autotransporter protein
VDSHNYDAFFSEIGVKAEYQFTKQFSLNGNLSYTQNVSGSEKNIGASLGGTPFAVVSPGLGNDFFTIGMGAQCQVTENVRLGINYRAEFSTDAEVANGLNIGGSYSF